MLPYKTLIHIDRTAKTPIYLQISNAFIKLITRGTLAPNLRLPGSRTLAQLLSVNRQTIIVAFEELEAQGWIEIRANQGSFVNAEIPIRQSQQYAQQTARGRRSESSFPLYGKYLQLPKAASGRPSQRRFRFDDGYPDLKLSPLKALSRHFSSVLNQPRTARLMTYSQSYDGDIHLRETLVDYLAESRSIHIDVDNILITRGSLMGFYLLFQTLLKPGDRVIVSNPGFVEGHATIQLAGGVLTPVSVDKEGMDVDQIEAICASETIRAVFIVPHHQYPTTVTLSPSRRVKLLQLAERYRFAIIEDDYDYDFHYASSPILPIASADPIGAVSYVGSFSKLIAPSLRLGFIVAPHNLIKQMSSLSRYLDSYGNTALERAVSILIREGELNRYLQKASRIYKERRDLFCQELEQQIGKWVHFQKPEGGLAVWVHFREGIAYSDLKRISNMQDLSIPQADQFWIQPSQAPSVATRLGFASIQTEKIPAAAGHLRTLLEACVAF